jgi:hypothetical protein
MATQAQWQLTPNGNSSAMAAQAQWQLNRNGSSRPIATQGQWQLTPDSACRRALRASIDMHTHKDNSHTHRYVPEDRR